MLLALGVFAIHPPGEIEQKLLEDPLEKFSIASALALLFDFVNAPGRPGVHRRIDVAERPLVGRHLAVRMHVPFARHEQELLLGEIGIDERERDAVKGEIPRRVPGIFPFVRHRDHVGIVEMAPLVVAALESLARRRAGQPGRLGASD